MSVLDRAQAWMTGAPLPGRRDEAFRWSDLSRALRAVPAASPPAAPLPGGGPFAGLAGREVVLVNGGSAEIVLGDEALALRIQSRSSSSAHLARVAVAVRPGARAVLLESYEGEGEAYFANTVIDISVGEGASLERIVVLDEPASAVSVSTAEVRLAPRSTFGQTTAATGARLQRHETEVRHPGGGAAARIDGLYLLGGDRHADLTTAVLHEGPGGETSQVIKGVAAGSARAVFQGRIVVAHGADGVDARMRHDALLLSDRAEVDAKPELEIYADDVSCAHGNTVGAIDPEALFYARQRGVPEHEAKVMLTEAFVAAVAERIEHEGARSALAALVQSRLGALA